MITDLKKPEKLYRNFRIATMATREALDAAGNNLLALGGYSEAYGQLTAAAIGVVGDRIAWIAPESELPTFSDDVEVVDGQQRWLTPALIDCHTHLVHGGNRASEWERRLEGVSYEQIAREGGGILSTVRDTRNASVEELVESARKRAERLIAEGVATIEIKSGYGLDLESELKMLQAAKKLGEILPIRVEPTLLAAHAVPPEFKGRSDAYIDLVCNEIIPAAAAHCTAVDAFCESIAFSVDLTVRVLQAGLDHGLKIKVHAEQLTRTGVAAEAARMGAVSVDHLEYLSAKDCRVLGEHGTVAVLLPGAFYCLGETQKPPIEAMREHNVPIALATDCNPGSSPVYSLLLIANMGCNLFGLRPEEALRGITIYAAKAIGLADELGSIEVGKRADFTIWNVECLAEISYSIGGNSCVEI